jgi:hypothetical protein
LVTETSAEAASDALTEWLLAGDPAIRWQVLRDLVHAPEATVRAERGRVSTQGWGAGVLAQQDVDGRWGGGLYNPKWTSTMYTLLLLQWLGLVPGHPQALTGCTRLWDGAAYFGGGITFGTRLKTPEICITGMAVLVSAAHGYLPLQDQRVEEAVAWLLQEQLADGGWNCATVRTGSHHGSFHTSISVLDGLAAYQAAGGKRDIRAAVERGQQFFLDHQLYLSHRSGRPANPAFRRFPFPPQWHFDIVRGLEHFRAWDAARDPRLGRAIAVLEETRSAAGTWSAYRGYPGREWFALETPAEPGRWATLRCSRILAWWYR